jgi:hypothetical protein
MRRATASAALKLAIATASAIAFAARIKAQESPQAENAPRTFRPWLSQDEIDYMANNTMNFSAHWRRRIWRSLALRRHSTLIRRVQAPLASN